MSGFANLARRKFEPHLANSASGVGNGEVLVTLAAGVYTFIDRTPEGEATFPPDF